MKLETKPSSPSLSSWLLCYLKIEPSGWAVSGVLVIKSWHLDFGYRAISLKHKTTGWKHLSRLGFLAGAGGRASEETRSPLWFYFGIASFYAWRSPLCGLLSFFSYLKRNTPCPICGPWRAGWSQTDGISACSPAAHQDPAALGRLPLRECCLEQSTQPWSASLIELW